jgi:hypothetical protein
VGLRAEKGRLKFRDQEGGLKSVFPSSAGVSPCISLKIKKRHHMIETHIQLSTCISDNIFFYKFG